MVPTKFPLVDSTEIGRQLDLSFNMSEEHEDEVAGNAIKKMWQN